MNHRPSTEELKRGMSYMQEMSEEDARDLFPHLGNSRVFYNESYYVLLHTESFEDSPDAIHMIVQRYDGNGNIPSEHIVAIKADLLHEEMMLYSIYPPQSVWDTMKRGPIIHLFGYNTPHWDLPNSPLRMGPLPDALRTAEGKEGG